MAVNNGNRSTFGRSTRLTASRSATVCTLQLKGIPDNVTEEEIKEALGRQHNEKWVQVERVRILKDTALVTVRANELGFQVLKDKFPIDIRDNDVTCSNEWCHSTATPPVVILRDLPRGVGLESVEMYLETQGIDVKSINENDEDNTIIIELNDPIDLPYLVVKNHFMRRQPVIFREISTPEEENSLEPTSGPSASENIYSYMEGIENVGPVSHENCALKITGIQFNETLAENALKYLFSKEPFHLQVDRCVVEGDIAYLTFTSEQGVSDVMAQPPTNLLGCPIECTSVQIADVSAFQPPPSMPQVLHISNIPAEMPDLFKQSLQILFTIAGHTMTECVIVGTEAYVKFQDQKSISLLLAHPPDNSTVLGHPVIYSSVDEDQTPLLPNGGDDVETSVVVVDGLPSDFPGLEEAFPVFLKNATKTQSNFSCEIKDGKAYIKYDDPKDMKKIAENPPNVPFIGNQLTYKTMTEPITGSHVHPRLEHHRPSDPTDLSSMNKSSVKFQSHIKNLPPPDEAEEETLPSSVPTPTPTPRTTSYSGTIVVKNIPDGVKDWVLKLYLQNLTGVSCQKIQMKGAMAVVEMKERIDVKSVRYKASISPFPEGNVILNIEALRPTTSVLIKGPKDMPSYVVDMYCGGFGEITEKKDHGPGEYVVRFRDKDSHQKILDQEMHSLGTQPLTIFSYHPVLAEIEQTDSVSSDTPPPLPPRPNYPYAWPSIREQIAPESESYYIHTLKEMNSDLLAIYGEARIRQGCLEVKPLELAHTLTDWNTRVHTVLNKYKQNLQKVELPIETQAIAMVLDHLSKFKETYRDLHYNLSGGVLKMVGHSQSVHAATEIINNMLTEEIEISIDIERPPQEIEYLLKFAKNEIKAVQPPVKIVTDRDNPGKLSACGVKKSLDRVKQIAEEKLSQVHTENILLTQTAHRLLSSRQGKNKIAEHLQDTMKSVTYVFEKIEQREEFTHQVCILSSDSVSCSTAKRKISSLIVEKKIQLSSERSSICSSQEWKHLTEEMASEFFARINVSGSVITLTGQDIALVRIAEQIDSFLDVQNAVTDEFPVKGAKWRIITEQQPHKLKEVEKDASKMKVKLEFPIKVGDDFEVFITLQGDVKSVDNIKGRLQMMLDEVIEKEVPLQPEPGLHQVITQGFLGTKCAELEFKHKVIIKYDSKEVSPIPARSSLQRLGSRSEPNAPHRLLHANSPNGFKVTIYSGDYTKKRCDVLTTFISETPNFQEDVFLTLAACGGHEVCSDIEASLGARARLISATVHKTQAVGNLKCSELYHVVLPCYTGAPRSNAVVERALYDFFSQVCINNSEVIITPFTCPPLNYPVGVCAQAILTVLASMNLGIYSDLSVMIFVDNARNKGTFEEKMRDLGYHIYHNPIAPPVNNTALLTQSSQRVGCRGSTDTLKNAIKISKGNMLDLVVDVYINSSNPNLDLSSGEISKKLKKMCGQKLVNEAQTYINTSGVLQPGQVAVTSADNTNAKAIYHVALPKYIETASMRRFRETIQNILQTAKTHGHKSIAIPCLGAANLGYPTSETAPVVFEEVVSFHVNNPDVITCFHFIVYRDSDYKDYISEYEKKIEQVDRITNQQPASMSTQGNQRRGTKRGVAGSGEGLKVQLLLGNITAEQTEVIVNSTSIDMRHDTNSICKAIHAAAGQDLRIACQMFVDQNVLLKDGMIVSTTASGTLRCNKIYHAHVPGKLKGVPPTQAQNDLLQKVVFNCLQLAEGEGQMSLAMPAFCLGVGNYTVPESAKPTLDAMKEFAKTNPTHLKDVHIVISGDRLYGLFYEYFCEYFLDDGLVKLPQPQKNGVYAVIGSQTVFRPRIGTMVPPQGKPNMKKCKITFKIYGLVQQTLTIVEKDLKAFIYEKIIHDMVDLGETANLLTELDYVEMDELGEENGVEVSIQPELSRVLVKGDERSVERVCHKIQMKVVTMSRLINDLRVYEWSSQGDDGMLKLYDPEISKQLEAGYQRNQRVLELMIGDVICTVDFDAMEERDVTGVTRAITRTRKVITDYPHTWNLKDMGNKIVHFESINATSNEYVQATRRFFETKGDSNYEIVKLQRIQNPSEYTRYQTLKKTWVMLHGQGSVMEKDLFHGTKKESIDPICSTGFNRGFAADANAAHYGKGVYFALNAWYSLNNKYSAVDSDGYKHILVCSLLVCKFTKGNGKMTVPPALPDNPQITYDTLVEKEDAPTIFVAMKDSQAYPKYWLTVKKV